MKRKLIAGILALALVATVFAVVSAQTNSGGPAPIGIGGRCGGPCMNQLTDEESAVIQQELRDYRQDLLEQYGITLTDEQREEIRQAMQEQRQEMCQQMQEFRQALLEQYDFPLTDEERQTIREQLQERKQERQQEMQEFRQELLEQYGLNLTDEERAEIRQQMQEFRQELFERYGISCPGCPHGAGEWGNYPGGPMGLRMQRFQRGPGFGEFAPT